MVVFRAELEVDHDDADLREGHHEDDEDQEEDDHVEEEHDLVMFDGSDKTNHRDKEEEDTRGCDASNDGKICDDASHFTWANTSEVK